MGTVYDRRDEPSRGRASRERLINRTKGAVRDAINQSINSGNIADIGKGGVDVTVPKGGLNEPSFRHARGGVDHTIIPGNNNPKAKHKAGDTLPRPKGGGGGGGGGGSGPGAGEGEGEDNFVYRVSEKEFLDILFDDLELPNLVKAALDDMRKALEQDGFSHHGAPNRISLVRSKIEKTKREQVMNRSTNRDIVALLLQQKSILSLMFRDCADETLPSDPAAEPVSIRQQARNLQREVMGMVDRLWDFTPPERKYEFLNLQEDLETLYQRRNDASRWREQTDLRFRAVDEVPAPVSKAVMFCEMDVSGSMTEEMKSNAKLFYFLLFRFLKRQYEKVDVVWVRHTDQAEEVDEKEFFEGRKTGGTKVSTGHEKLVEIQAARYPARDWNIYVAQASDGDHSRSDDAPTLAALNKLLPLVQGFFYVEIATPGSTPVGPSTLWEAYDQIRDKFKDRFWSKRVNERKDIWPVFREFFTKRTARSHAPQPRATALNYG